MRDHTERPVPRGVASRSVGVRELKAHTARILRQVRDSRMSYLVTHRGRAIGVILPVEQEDGVSPTPESPEAATAWDSFVHAGRRLERRFAPGVSGVGLLSGMRR